MLEKPKSHKISVLNKMIGLGEEVQPPYIVPQNSINNFRQKAAVGENSTRNPEKAADKCPHCENMAKNFLYLESLIRTNYANNRKHCNVCHSSLGYLQYVNKSIMEVFGNFDSIVKAAKAFSDPLKHTKAKSMKQRKPAIKVVTSSAAHQAAPKKSSTKNKPSSAKVIENAHKSRIGSHFSLKAVRVQNTVGKLKRNINLKSFSSNSLTNTKKSHSTKRKTKNILRMLKPKK